MRRPVNPGGSGMADPTLPSLEWLLDCSESSLQDLEMAALDRGSRRLKAAKAEWHEAVAQFANAEIARYFRDHRGEILEQARRTFDAEKFVFPERRKTA